jgi:hypothetical protein
MSTESDRTFPLFGTDQGTKGIAMRTFQKHDHEDDDTPEEKGTIPRPALFAAFGMGGLGICLLIFTLFYALLQTKEEVPQGQGERPVSNVPAPSNKDALLKAQAEKRDAEERKRLEDAKRVEEQKRREAEDRQLKERLEGEKKKQQAQAEADRLAKETAAKEAAKEKRLDDLWAKHGGKYLYLAGKHLRMRKSVSFPQENLLFDKARVMKVYGDKAVAILFNNVVYLIVGYDTNGVVSGEDLFDVNLFIYGTVDLPLAKGGSTTAKLATATKGQDIPGLTREQFQGLLKKGVDLE